MTDFKAKMHQILPQTPLGSLQRSPRPPSWIWGRCFVAGEGLGWGRGGEREGGGSGGEGKGGPPSYC